MGSRLLTESKQTRQTINEWILLKAADDTILFWCRKDAFLRFCFSEVLHSSVKPNENYVARNPSSCNPL